MSLRRMVVIVLMLLSAHAWADWVRVVEREQITTYVDHGTITKSADVSMPAQMGSLITASKLDAPGLNVAVKDPTQSYGLDATDNVKIAIRLGDVLDAGGKIYHDDGALARRLTPMYVTFDGAIAFKVAE